MLENGKHVALISDAGTPGISDPWYALVSAALAKWYEVTALPWASAVITALSASGKSSHHFLYLWFLPVKKGRQTLLKRISENYSETVVIYESVHRMMKTLRDLKNYFGEDHEIVAARELTKKFEQYVRWNIKDVENYFELHQDKLKGEFVILI